MSLKGQVMLVCDYGNPDDTGEAKLVIDNLESADAATAAADMDTFADSLVTGLFTGAAVSDVAITETTANYKDKPAADVNADAQLIVLFRKKDTKGTRKMTISGIDVDSTVLEATAQGKRLTAAAKLTLAGYIDTLFGWTGQAVVKVGKLIVKY